MIALSVAMPLITPSVLRAERGGFTLEISSGVGSFSSFQIEGDNVLEPAVAPLSVGIGGFVSSNVAILGRASIVLFNYSPDALHAEQDSRLSPQLTRSAFLGSTLQYWVSDSWMIESGLGLSLIGNGPVEAQFNRGVGIPGRVGWTLAEAGNGSLSAVFELFPSFYSRGETTLSSTLGVQWQWL